MPVAVNTVTKPSFLAIFVCVLLFVAAVAAEPQPSVNKGADGVAIKGYDVVAYFTDGRPTPGKADYTHAWQDATWQFANAKHRDLFAADPEKYAPQFGGHCAMALTNNVVLEVDPEAWTITDGKLYLNFSMKGRDMFREDLAGNIKKSEANWAKIQKQQ